MAGAVFYDEREHHFVFSPEDRFDLKELKAPLSVSLQVTRSCNLKCSYCSEAGEVKPPSLTEIEKMISNLSGVKRIILTGGEPLIRNDFLDIVKYARKLPFEIIALATNGVLVGPDIANELASLVDYVDVTIDGPRKLHNRIRGEYDAVIRGVETLKDAGLPFSLVTVLYRDNADGILYTCQIADVLGAKKLKIMLPIPKGRGRNIVDKALNSDEIQAIFHDIRLEKESNGWTSRITLTDWSKVGEGHAILVHPNGEVVASPVPSEEECVTRLGNILRDNIESIWDRYPYKQNHLNKYSEKTLNVC